LRDVIFVTGIFIALPKRDMRNTRVPVMGLKPSLAKASTTPPAKIRKKSG